MMVTNIFQKIFTRVTPPSGGASGDKYKGSADDWSIIVFVVINKKTLRRWPCVGGSGGSGHVRGRRRRLVATVV